MAPKDKAGQRQAEWAVVFVSCNLDKATKEQLKAWDPKGVSTIDGISRMVDDGYKLSISADKMHDAIGVYATMPDKSHKHHGLCLSSRGPDVMGALKALVYKHFTVLEQAWDADVHQRDEWGSWG